MPFLMQRAAALMCCLFLGSVSADAAPCPYAADTNTLVLFHFDGKAGSTAATNTGLPGGTAYSVSMASASASPPLASNVFGAAGYAGFGNAAGFTVSGQSVGFDANGSGAYEGETNDALLMSALSLGNGDQTPWTLEAMICPTATNVNQEIISTDSSAAARGFQFRLDNAAELELNLIGLGLDIKAPIPTSGAHAYAPNAWYHAAASYDGSTIRLYWTRLSASVSGANLLSATSAAVGASFGAVKGPLVIGNENRAVGGEYFQGLIDEVRISNIARQAAEMPARDLAVAGPYVSPADDPIYTGTVVTLSAVVGGVEPLLSSWRTDGGSGGVLTNIPGANASALVVDTGGMGAGAYAYALCVSNSVGAITSAVVKLNLAIASGPLLVADTAVAPSQTQSGGTVEMSAQFAGTPPIQYQWFYRTNGGSGRPISGATNPAHTLASVVQAQSGSYWLQASNCPPGLGARTAASSPASLRVSNGNWSFPPRANPPDGLLCELLRHPEETVISALRPKFGWSYQPSTRNDTQAGFRILVASSRAGAEAEAGDMWDSGLVRSPLSLNISYGGSALSANMNYYWRVQTLDGAGRLSGFSATQNFRTAGQLFDPLTNGGAVYLPPAQGSINGYPLRYVPVAPARVVTNSLGHWLVDFGKDAFGFATLHLNGNYSGANVSFGLGESAANDVVNTSPGSTIRYRSGSYTLRNGDWLYTNRSSVSVGGLSPPASPYGLVSPFRYLELAGIPAGAALGTNAAIQWRLQTEFDDTAAAFSSSSPALNRIWDLCRYSMKALSFDGIYVDGDRERTPYEADAYIHQLGSYGVDYDYTLARCTFEYLTNHLTWPTEWPMHMVLIAWADYQQTGEPYLITRYYGFLTNKCLWAARAEAATGLLKSWPASGNSTGSPADLIDWYRVSGDGVGNTDGYVAKGTNAVINAFYYRCLTILAQVAQQTGRNADASDFLARASQVYSNYNSTFWSSGSQSYIDGVGTAHASANANFFPLAFGLVPAERQAAVARYIESRIAALGGMPAGVYGAQYLLEGLFQAGAVDTALGLMMTNGARSWMNMINAGSTLTMEAWGSSDKPNQDWNHAWGAAPGNIIPRYVLGLKPLAPGFGVAEIRPQLGTGSGLTGLTHAEGTIPTIRGPVSVSVENSPGSFHCRVQLPGNMTANVLVPTKGLTNPVVLLDGDVAAGTVSNGWLAVAGVGSGQHALWLATAASTAAERYANWADAYFGTNAGNADLGWAGADPDQDGSCNSAEFIAGTNPLDATSRLLIDSVTRDGATQAIRVTVTGRAGRRYALEATTQLNASSWSTVATNDLPTPEQAVVLEDSSPGASQRFYRVRVRCE
jgi:hypothetical protein